MPHGGSKLSPSSRIWIGDIRKYIHMPGYPKAWELIVAMAFVLVVVAGACGPDGIACHMPRWAAGRSGPGAVLQHGPEHLCDEALVELVHVSHPALLEAAEGRRHETLAQRGAPAGQAVAFLRREVRNCVRVCLVLRGGEWGRAQAGRFFPRLQVVQCACRPLMAW